MINYYIRISVYYLTYLLKMLTFVLTSIMLIQIIISQHINQLKVVFSNECYSYQTECPYM